ncbi:MAG: glycosyl hydrolase family 18 protein [Anaerovoracaceae bacterium]|jgi:spore germination protein
MPWYDIKASQYGTILVNGYAYPFIEQSTLEQWMPDLTYLSSFSYGFTASGLLIPIDDLRLRQTAEAHNVATMMVIAPIDEEGRFNNFLVTSILNDPAARDRLIENIYNEAINRGFSGVDFDFEYIPVENREDYVTLVSMATARLNPAGLITSVALAPKTSADQPGLLYEGHDYAGLGVAANLVLLMTYEWGYTFGPPMAVAPLNNVRQVLDYAVTEIPREKILMGIPNYGYDWTLPFVQGESMAESLSSVEARARAAQVGAEIQFDEVAQSPFYEYTDAQGRQHIVWFEDGRSIRAKLELVNEFDLAGISFWTIMYPFPSAQEVLNELFTVAKVE